MIDDETLSNLSVNRKEIRVSNADTERKWLHPCIVSYCKKPRSPHFNRRVLLFCLGRLTVHYEIWGNWTNSTRSRMLKSMLNWTHRQARLQAKAWWQMSKLLNEDVKIIEPRKFIYGPKPEGLNGSENDHYQITAAWLVQYSESW